MLIDMCRFIHSLQKQSDWRAGGGCDAENDIQTIVPYQVVLALHQFSLLKIVIHFFNTNKIVFYVAKSIFKVMACMQSTLSPMQISASI